MKNKKAATAWGSFFAGLGFAIAVIIALLIMADFTDYTDRFLLMLGLVLMLLFMVVYGIIVLHAEVVRPAFQRRHAAIKALGKHGVINVMRDPTAKLAYKGIVELFKDNYPKAEELLNLAFNRSEFRQNQVFCIEWLIKLYEATNADSSKLLWAFRKAAELSPDSSEAQCRLGHAYFVDGKLEQAVYRFEQALRYDPNNGYAMYSLAKVHIVRGEDEIAFKTLGDLIKINENHPLVYAELAVLHAMHGDREKSQEFYNKAQLCGYHDPTELNKRITALFEFANAEGADGSDLPSDYYRRIVKPEDENTDEKENTNA